MCVSVTFSMNYVSRAVAYALTCFTYASATGEENNQPVAVCIEDSRGARQCGVFDTPDSVRFNVRLPNVPDRSKFPVLLFVNDAFVSSGMVETTSMFLAIKLVSNDCVLEDRINDGKLELTSGDCVTLGTDLNGDYRIGAEEPSIKFQITCSDASD